MTTFTQAVTGSFTGTMTLSKHRVLFKAVTLSVTCAKSLAQALRLSRALTISVTCAKSLAAHPIFAKALTMTVSFTGKIVRLIKHSMIAQAISQSAMVKLIKFHILDLIAPSVGISRKITFKRTFSSGATIKPVISRVISKLMIPTITVTKALNHTKIKYVILTVVITPLASLIVHISRAKTWLTEFLTGIKIKGKKDW